MTLRFPVLAVALAMLAACGAREGADEPSRTAPGVDGPPAASSLLRRAISAEPESLDPHLARSVPATKVLGDLFEGLVTLGPDGSLQAGASADWTVSEDGLTWTFRLRPGLTWSNGDPLTAEDFVWSFRRLVDPATGAFYGSNLMPLAGARRILEGEADPDTLGVAAPDGGTVVLRLAYPVGDLLHRLAHPSAAPVHRASVEEWGDDYPAPKRLVGNGPYRLVERVIGGHIGLEKNGFYRDPVSVPIERVRYYPLEDEMAEYNRYRAGELDITARVPAPLFRDIETDRPRELRVAPYLGVYYLGFNLSEPPFLDAPDLRRALSLAIDRRRIAGTLAGRGELPAWSWTPPAVRDYSPPRFDYADKTADARAEEARRLYREAGYGAERPLRFRLRYNTSDENRRIATALQSMWRDVLGAEVELVNQEFRVLIAETRRGDIPGLFRGSWIADYNDVGNFLTVLTSGHTANHFGYSNPAFDSLVAAAIRERGDEERAGLFANAERLLLAEHPVLPIFFYVSKHLVHPRVGGWVDNSLDYHYSRYLRLREPPGDETGD
jgi:oligopeptide transport system substrate-binding protein